MFCIKSDIITLESIEMYGFVTVWTSMDDGPYWVILLMYGSHEMRHTGFRRFTMVNGTPSRDVTQIVQQVKSQVKELPCLGIVHPEAFPIIETNASNIGYGGILREKFQ